MARIAGSTILVSRPPRCSRQDSALLAGMSLPCSLFRPYSDLRGDLREPWEICETPRKSTGKSPSAALGAFAGLSLGLLGALLYLRTTGLSHQLHSRDSGEALLLFVWFMSQSWTAGRIGPWVQRPCFDGPTGPAHRSHPMCLFAWLKRKASSMNSPPSWCGAPYCRWEICCASIRTLS